LNSPQSAQCLEIPRPSLWALKLALSALFYKREVLTDALAKLT